MERVYHLPILLADTESTDGTFTGVIIHWNITVFKENSQVTFLIQGIGKGFFCFSTFGEWNLQEIKTLTGQGLDYVNLDQLREKLQNQGFEVLHLSEQIEYLDFATPKQILQHLKATGVTATASSFRWTKHSLERFYQDYQQFSQLDTSGQIHYRLSYHPIYCIARRMP